MAISGHGSQFDPYVVHNYTEFRAICVGQGYYWYSAGAGLYIRLDGDIQSDTWENMTASNGDMCVPTIDCNGHTITIHVADGADVDYVLPTNSVVHHGRIYANDYIKNATLTNMKIYGGIISRSYVKNCEVRGDVNNRCGFTQCDIYTCRFTFKTEYSYIGGITSCRLICCDILLNGAVRITYDNIPNIIRGTSNDTIHPSHMYRCRIRGKLAASSMTIPDKSQALLVDGSYTMTTPTQFRGYFMYECILSVDASDIIIDPNTRALRMVHPEHYKQCYVDVSSYPNEVYAGIATITHENVTNGNYLRSVGFPVYDG